MPYTQNGVMSDELMRIDVGIIAMNVCNRENAYNGSVVPGTLCAGSMFGGRGACPVKDIKCVLFLLLCLDLILYDSIGRLWWWINV